MKLCPSCKRTWPDAGKFCPMDGAALEPVRPAAEAAEIETVRVQPAPAPRPEPRKAEPKRVQVEPKPAPEPKAAAEPKPAAEGPKKGKRQFSETKWFMVGDQIKEDDLSPEEQSVTDLQKAYKPTQELPPEVRKKFSLDYDTADDPAGGGKKK